MIGHEKTFDDFAFQDVTFDDLCNIGFSSHPVPDALRINHDAWSILAMVQTAGLIGAHDAFEADALHFFLEEGMQAFRALIRAASARVFLRSLIDTDKDMPLEASHSLTDIGVVPILIPRRGNVR